MIRRLIIRARVKLVDRHGDTMVEALTAILIAVLGATMLATMVVTATSVAARSERSLSESYTAETDLNKSAGVAMGIEVVIPSDPSAPDGSSVKGSTAKTKVMLYSSDAYEYYREGNN